MIRNSIIIISTLLFSAVGVACGESNDTISFSTNWEYHNPTSNDFPIMASDVCPTGIALNQRQFNELKDCGFNIVRISPRYVNIEEANEYASKSGVQLNVVLTEHLNPEKCLTQINRYRNLSNVGMFDFGDESNIKDMYEIAKSFNLARSIKIRQLPIFNRGVIYNSEIENRDLLIQKELSTLQNLFHPAVWCFDRYPIMLKYPDERVSDIKYPDNVPYISHDMFLCLEEYRNISNSTDRPFWYYVLSMDHEAYEHDLNKNYKRKRHVHRLATKEYMTFSVFSSLAYGAKGLRFWTYCLRKDPTDGREKYINAPIDLNGNKTNLWYDVRDVICEVRKFQNIFLHSKISEVYHSGTTKYYATTPQPKSPGPFQSLKSGKQGILTSLFTSGNRNFVLIVNQDINSNQKIKGSLDKSYNISHVLSDNIKEKIKNSFSFTLSAGGYILLEYENREARQGL